MHDEPTCPGGKLTHYLTGKRLSMIKNLTFKVDNEVIAGTIFSKDDDTILPKFIFLHGGGVSTKESVQNIASPIINMGMNILAFDFSGQGESTGELKKSSLQKRQNEATVMINQFSSKEPLIVCGASMGGYIAIKMLESHQIDTLILLCPAIYDRKSVNVRFDSGFTEIIRKNLSWLDSDALFLLEKFKGKLLIVIGDRDEVIPLDVIKLIFTHAKNAKKREIHMIPGCPHQMFAWVNSNRDELIKLEEKIVEYSS